MPVLRTNIATNDDLVPHLTCTVAAPDLQIRGGEWSSRPWDKEDLVLKKIFSPSGLSLVQK